MRYNLALRPMPIFDIFVDGSTVNHESIWTGEYELCPVFYSDFNLDIQFYDNDFTQLGGFMDMESNCQESRLEE